MFNPVTFNVIDHKIGILSVFYMLYIFSVPLIFPLLSSVLISYALGYHFNSLVYYFFLVNFFLSLDYEQHTVGQL